jgi:hypothetical protein
VNRASTLGRVLRAHPFLLLGVLTYALFLTLETSEARTGPEANGMAGVTRVLILPMYVGWLLATVMIVQLFGPTPTLGTTVLRALHITFGFAPYILADALLSWFKMRNHQPAA